MGACVSIQIVQNDLEGTITLHDRLGHFVAFTFEIVADGELAELHRPAQQQQIGNSVLFTVPASGYN